MYGPARNNLNATTKVGQSPLMWAISNKMSVSMQMSAFSNLATPYVAATDAHEANPTDNALPTNTSSDIAPPPAKTYLRQSQMGVQKKASPHMDEFLMSMMFYGTSLDGL